ncbi:MAG: FecR domain-containing protein [Kiritimatiellae bacterium]|nr:FecR domain-containing protein [Kiritimatiellia bacterium]
MSDGGHTQELVCRYIEDGLDEAGLHELEELLDSDADACRAYVRELRVHAWLTVRFRRSAQGAGAPARGVFRRVVRWVPVSIAAALLVALGVSVGVRRAAPAAVVGQVRGEVLLVGPRASVPIHEGQQLRRGAVIRTGGGASGADLDLAAGAKVTLHAFTHLDLRGDSGPYVRVGTIDAIVSKRRASRGGFVCETPHAVLEVAGTRFTLRVARKENAPDAAGTTRLEVSEGAMLCTRRIDDRPVRVDAGRYTAIQFSGEIVTGALPSGGVGEGLIGYWPFDEGTGQTAYDLSGYGNHGTLKRGPAWTEGVAGGALAMNGRDSHVEIPAAQVLDPGLASFSYALWVNATESTGDHDMPWVRGGTSAYNPGYSVELGRGTWKACLSDGKQLCEMSFGRGEELVGKWVHLAAVIDREARQARLYRDGALVLERDISDLGALWPRIQARLGVTRDYEGRLRCPFLGRIDEMRVYNRALSEVEVRSLAQLGR